MEKGQFGWSKALSHTIICCFQCFYLSLVCFYYIVQLLNQENNNQNPQKRGASGRRTGADDGKKNKPFFVLVADFIASSRAFFSFSLTSTISITIGDTAAGLPHNNGGQRKDRHLRTIHTQVIILGICLLEKQRGVF